MHHWVQVHYQHFLLLLAEKLSNVLPCLIEPQNDDMPPKRARTPELLPFFQLSLFLPCVGLVQKCDNGQDFEI